MLTGDGPNLGTLGEEITAAGKELTANAESFLESCGDASLPAPKTLFHFTDCEGLIGIFKEKTLRASLATALNDASETKYDRFRGSVFSALEAHSIRPNHFPAEVA